jgi:hypothetical protein
LLTQYKSPVMTDRTVSKVDRGALPRGPAAARYGAGVIPASTGSRERKYPTVFEGNVGVLPDLDDPVRGGMGDLSVHGALFTDTIAEQRPGNTINMVSPVGLTSATVNIAERPITAPPKPGQLLDIMGTPYTAGTATPEGSAVTDWSAVNIGRPVVQAAHPGVTFPGASSLRIEGPPQGDLGDGDAYALRVVDGPVIFGHDGEKALEVRGGVKAGDIRAESRLRLGEASLLPPAAPAPGGYALTLPDAGPGRDGAVVASTAGGRLSFVNPVFSSAWSGQQPADNLIVWTTLAVSAGGTVTVSPTRDNGTPIFTTIFLASASPMANTEVVTSMPLTSLRNISQDRKTIVFNILTAVVADVGETTLQYAPEGTPVSVSVLGY